MEILGYFLLLAWVGFLCASVKTRNNSGVR